MRLMFAPWLAALACAMPAAAAPLGEDEVLRLFFARNLDLIAARYDVDAARALELVAAALPNPQLSLDAYEFAPRTGVSGAARAARIDQLIELGGKRRLRIASARYGRQAAEADLEDALRTLGTAVRKAYYTLLIAQKAAALAREEASHYAEIARVNALRFKSGDIAETDAMRIEVEAASARSDLDHALADCAKARDDLALLLAWPAQAETLEVAATWPGMPAPPPALGTFVERALATRPDLAAARLRAEAAGRDLKLARAGRIPDVTVGVDYTHDPSNNARDSGGVGISLPLPLFNRHEGEIDAARVALAAAELKAEQARIAVCAEITSDYAAWQAADRVVRRFEGEVLTRVREIRTAAELSYTKGATTVLDLIDAERSYKSTLHDYYTAMNERTLTWAALAAASGERLAP